MAFSFFGGVHPKENKHYSEHCKVQDFPAPDLLVIPMQQHIGAPCQALVKKGDRVLEVHIPKAGRLDPDECDASFQRSREFFDKYFPEKPYALLSCHSWLLDEGLCEYLPEGSNILTFGNRFKRQHSDESLAIIQYTFRWDTRISNLAYAYPTSEFARKIQRAALSGKPFYETLGVIEK